MLATDVLVEAWPTDCDTALDVLPFVALDEGHGFQKKENRDVMTAAIAHFLERQLLGEAR